MELDGWLTIIGSYAFPIAVTIYLLWERTTVTKDLTKAVTELSATTDKMIEYIKGGLRDND